MQRYIPYYFLVLLPAWLAACVKPYTPEPVKADNHFLVVDGVINASPGSETTISLSRTTRLGDSLVFNPERNAQVWIEGSSGGSYPVADWGDGTYRSGPLTLQQSGAYRLRIRTAAGKEYQSDFVPVKVAPPIDSLNWKQDNNIVISVNTHDPAGNTRYYRWEYKETWEYHSFYETDLYVKDRYIYYADSNFQVYRCWDSAYSSDIVTRSTVNLSEDQVRNYPVATVIRNSGKMAVRYSILVKQYAITEGAFRFWQILEKNTEQLGTLFDAQPSQLKGNLVCVSDPAEPVIGFVSAGTASEARIFIDAADLVDWVPDISGFGCPLITVPYNTVDYRIFDYPDTSYSPYYFVTGGGMVLSKKYCLVCTELGGTNFKPSYWR